MLSQISIVCRGDRFSILRATLWCNPRDSSAGKAIDLFLLPLWYCNSKQNKLPLNLWLQSSLSFKTALQLSPSILYLFFPTTLTTTHKSYCLYLFIHHSDSASPKPYFSDTPYSSSLSPNLSNCIITSLNLLLPHDLVAFSYLI